MILSLSGRGKRRFQNLGIAFLVLTITTSQFAYCQNEPVETEAEPSLIPDYLEAEVNSIDGKKWHEKINEQGITGSLRTGLWSSNRLNNNENNLLANSLWLRLDKRVKRGITLFAEGYFYNEDSLGNGNSEDRIKETYVHLRHGEWDYRFGRQIIAWGRTDRLNPTDNLGPRDFTLLSPEIDEERMGVEAIKISRVFGFYSSLTAAWVLNFKPNQLPPANTPGLEFIDAVPADNQNYAVKFDQTGGAIDWSASYYSGLDLNADLSAIGLSGSDILVQQTYHRIKILGADLATIAGSNRYAAEIAYTKTQDSNGNDITKKNGFFYGVLGIERDFGDNLGAIGQFFYREVSDYLDPRNIQNLAQSTVASLSAIASNQLYKSEYGLNYRIAKLWFNDSLELELAGTSLLKRNGHLLRPKITYSVNDNVRVTAGGEYFEGAEDTIFGLQKQNKLLFLEARYFF